MRGIRRKNAVIGQQIGSTHKSGARVFRRKPVCARIAGRCATIGAGLPQGKRHPAKLGEEEVTRFLTHLAVRDRVSPSTQNQALSAILFLYREILHEELPWLKDVVRAKRSSRLPVVLTVDEIQQVLAGLSGTPWLSALLMYGAGLRLMETVRFRVKDIDFGLA